jgi:hypothetical protein
MYALKYFINKIKNRKGFEMEGTRQLLLCANYIRLFGNNVATTKENTGSPLVISNGDGILTRRGVG